MRIFEGFSPIEIRFITPNEWNHYKCARRTSMLAGVKPISIVFKRSISVARILNNHQFYHEQYLSWNCKQHNLVLAAVQDWYWIQSNDGICFPLMPKQSNTKKYVKFRCSKVIIKIHSNTGWLRPFHSSIESAWENAIISVSSVRYAILVLPGSLSAFSLRAYAQFVQ